MIIKVNLINLIKTYYKYLLNFFFVDAFKLQHFK